MAREQNGICVSPPRMSFADIAGRRDIVSLLRALVYDEDIDGAIGLKKARAVVLCGPKGCGKSSLSTALAGELALEGYVCTEVNAADLPTDMTEQVLKLLSKSPCVLTLRNVEKLCDTGELDRLLDQAETAWNPLIVVTATEYEIAKGLTALREFNFIYVPMPQKFERDAYFRMKLGDSDASRIAKLSDECRGYSYAEMAATVNYLLLLSKNNMLNDNYDDIEKIIDEAISCTIPPERTTAEKTVISSGSGAYHERDLPGGLYDDDDDDGFSGLDMFMK